VIQEKIKQMEKKQVNLKNTKIYADENFTNYFRKFSINTKNSYHKHKPNDDLKLFRLEDEFAKITLPLLLEFENRMKKIFIDYLIEKNIPGDFYLDRAYFKNNFSSYVPPKISKSWIFYKKVIEKLQVSGKIQRNYKYGTSFVSDTNILRNHDFETIVFYISIGSFFSILSNLKFIYLGDFANKFVKSTANNFDDHTFFKFLLNIRYLRNRLAHTNHCLSKYLENEMSLLIDIHNDEKIYTNYSSKLSKTIMFMLNNISSQRRDYYSRKYFIWLMKNKSILDRYNLYTNLESGLIKKSLNANKHYKQI
jgi:hypothetical protein